MKTFKTPLGLMAVSLMAFMAASLMAPGPLAAQTDREKSRLSRELQRTMAREAPMTEDDYRVYMANLDAIFSLRQSPERVADTARSISEWPDSRFAYVTTKMAVGMSLLLKPDDPRNSVIPDFARPNEREMALIRRHRDELVKSVEALQAEAGR